VLAPEPDCLAHASNEYVPVASPVVSQVAELAELNAWRTVQGLPDAWTQNSY